MGSYGKFKVFFLALVIILLCLSGGPIPAADEAQNPAQGAATGSEYVSDLDVITIENEGYERDKYGPVTFPHKRHAKDFRILCWECHHNYKDGVNIWLPWEETLSCGECHEPVAGKEGATSLKKAYHVGCRTCHKDLEKQKKASGPGRGCYGCHEKKKTGK